VSVNGSGWLTVAEAAARLGCHTRTIYDGVAAATIPHRRVGRAIRLPAWWADGADLEHATAPGAEPGTATDLDRDDDLEGRPSW
jgi:excisionase family DNA binding protein